MVTSQQWSMKFKAHIRSISASLLALTLFTACSSGDNQQRPAESSAELAIGVPALITTVRAIDLNNLILETVVNGGEPTSTAGQPGNRWNVTIDALPNQTNVVDFSWIEQFRGVRLLLATARFEFDVAQEAISLSFNDRYVTDEGPAFDVDQDGASNLEERNEETDPLGEGSGSSEPREPQMVEIEAGCFDMGSPAGEVGRTFNEALHNVCVDAFAIGRFEVIYGEYERFANATGRVVPFHPAFGRAEGDPVVEASWIDAVAFADWLSAVTGRSYRLPTEAEWEYAARARTQSPWYTGNNITLDEANFTDDEQESIGRPVNVGSYPPNGFGLNDMLGNVEEMTCSFARPDYDGSELLCDLREDVLHSVRGGSWRDDSIELRSAFRSSVSSTTTSFAVGFRLVRD